MLEFCVIQKKKNAFSQTYTHYIKIIGSKMKSTKRIQTPLVSSRQILHKDVTTKHNHLSILYNCPGHYWQRSTNSKINSFRNSIKILFFININHKQRLTISKLHSKTISKDNFCWTFSMTTHKVNCYEKFSRQVSSASISACLYFKLSGPARIASGIIKSNIISNKYNLNIQL